MDTYTHTGTLIAIPETEYVDEKFLAEFEVAEWFTLYVVPHDGMSTVDVATHAVENVLMHYIETPEHLREAARDEIEGEGNGRDVLMRGDVDRWDSRFKVRLEVSEELDEDEEVSPWYHLDRLIEQVVTGAAGEPEILNYATWAAWRAERTEKRRARNLPPLANFGANGLDNLPLFVHAANALMQPRKALVRRAADRFGYCTAHRMEKRPLERLNWSWPL